MPNPVASLSRRLKSGDHLALAWTGFADPSVPESLVRLGYDVALVDLQHGAWTFDTACAAISACNGAGKPCLARIPVGDFALASRLLDAGAAGIVAPMINSVEDAVAFADFCKFPPLGRRSWGPMRAIMSLGLDGPDYLRQANGLQVAIAMIETRAALDALDAILDTPGIDGVLVGPSDLSIALSGGTLNPDAPEVDEALTRVAEACRARGKTAAVFCFGGAQALKLHKRGFQLATYSYDHGLLMRAAAAELAAGRE